MVECCPLVERWSYHCGRYYERQCYFPLSHPLRRMSVREHTHWQLARALPDNTPRLAALVLLLRYLYVIRPEQQIVGDFAGRCPFAPSIVPLPKYKDVDSLLLERLETV